MASRDVVLISGIFLRAAEFPGAELQELPLLANHCYGLLQQSSMSLLA
jgi:hypothetical protein